MRPNMQVGVIFVLCSFSVSVLSQDPERVLADWTNDVSFSVDPKQPFSSLFRPYLDFINSVFRSLQENSSSFDISAKCQSQTKHLVEFADDGDAGALSFFDASGKPSSGMLKGGISLIGYYSQCLNAKVENTSVGYLETGMYCFIKLEFLNATTVFPRASFDVLRQSKPVIAICVPSSCSTGDVQTAVGDSLSSLSAKNFSSECYIKDNDSLNAPAACVLTIFVVFAVIAFSATVYDLNGPCFSKTQHPKTKSATYGSSSNEVEGKIQTISCEEIGSTVQLHKSKSKKVTWGARMEPFILAFSLRRNAAKVFSVEQTTDSIPSLHGLRFLSMALIIFGHTYSFATQDMYFRNPDVMAEAPKSFVAQILANGTLAVDTFYFISGLLVALVTLKVMKHKEGKLPLLHFYLHRYIRLTPLFMIVIAFSATILQYLSSGPSWNFSIMMYSPWCRKNWYLNALYLHNFVHTAEMCLSHSWYLATDMQFYIVTPLIIVPLYKSRLWGAIVIGVFMVATTVTTGVITAINKFPAIPYINNAEPLELMNEYYTDVYIKPYCRMGPYLIGIIIGYILWERKVMTMRKLYVAIGWGLTYFLMMFVLFIMRGANEGHLPSVDAAASYSALARTTWAAGLGWIVLMCQYGRGGIINNILSFKCFVPLSRLTYSAYLIHPIIMAVYYGSTETTVDFSYHFMLYLFIGNCVITYTISLILSLLFESPIIGLEKACQRRK